MKSTLIIPVYNDTERLKTFLPKLMVNLPEHFEVMVCDDGSTEAEKTKLLRVIELSQHFWEKEGKTLLPPLLSPKNLGKGATIIKGWAASNPQSDILAFADADGAVSAKEITRAEQFFRTSSYEALFGSRIQILGRTINRSFKRYLSSRIFAKLVSTIGNIQAYDTQCGLKLLQRNAYQTLAPYLQTQRFAFDVELALLLKHFNLSTIEFPVDWSDIPGSKVKLLQDSLQMSQEVIRIKHRIRKIPKNTHSE